METIQINSLNNFSSRICLGTWAIGGWLWGGTEEQESIKTIHAALDNDINMIDTAPVYGFGLAEEIVGKAIRQYGKRDRIILATKAGLEWRDNKVFRNSKPNRIKQEIEDSLRRLQTDYIDLYQIHWPDLNTPFEDTAATMLDLLKEGKIRAIGLSNFSVEQLKIFQSIAPVHTSQPPYNLFEREIESELLPYTEKTGIITLAYGALCRGLLSGKMNINTQFNGDDIRKSDPKFQPLLFPKYLNAVNELNQFAQHNYGKNVLALAIRWILDQGHTIALWGARHPEQIKAVNEVIGWTLDKNAQQQINEILQKNIISPVGAEFMSPP